MQEKILSTEGCENLVNAIYERAVKDYVYALINGNKGEITKIEKFLRSGAYGRTKEFGQSLIEKTRREVKLVTDFINEFVDSDEKGVTVKDGEYVYSFLCVATKVMRLKRKRRGNEKTYIYKPKNWRTSKFDD